MFRFILVLALFVTSFSQSEFIKSSNLMNTVKYLASEELNGRLGGSEGYFKAANFIADEFSKLNLLPFKGESYFQTFNVEYNEIVPPYSLDLITNDDVIKKYKLGDDFVFRGFTGSGNFTAEVVFAGYGISAPELGYDDYEGIDVDGKVVMVFKENPRWKIDEHNWPERQPAPEIKSSSRAWCKRNFVYLFSE
ncbi:MAG: hypothetical protein U5K00_17225 [Melioribacteraceae bacterium]|nr:hypothetical protein [Melioribacteraceae bacterium]